MRVTGGQLPLATASAGPPQSPPRSPARAPRAAPSGRARAARALAKAEPGGEAQQATATVEPAQAATAAGQPAAAAAAPAAEPAKQLRLAFGTANLPHPDKTEYGGEDAFFLSPVGGGAFGVADGVGGWQDSGINPAEYSRTFMRLACAYLEGKTVAPVSPAQLAAAGAGLASSGGGGGGRTPADASLPDAPPADGAGLPGSMALITPEGALTAAHQGTRLPGSTTACVLRLNRASNSLSAANLGDSGFLLVRNGEAKVRSLALQHFFDCPLQFAAFPDYTSATDRPEDARSYEIPLQPGDVIVAATDGLWDNVPQAEILELLPRFAGRMPEAAQALAELASRHARDKKYPSPYSQEAAKQGINLPFVVRLATASFQGGRFRLGTLRGGKLDDITVVTALVQEEDVPPPPPPPPAVDAAADAESEGQAEPQPAPAAEATEAAS